MMDVDESGSISYSEFAAALFPELEHGELMDHVEEACISLPLMAIRRAYLCPILSAHRKTAKCVDG